LTLAATAAYHASHQASHPTLISKEAAVDAIDVEFRRIAEFPNAGLVSEEDVKNKIILPMLRALGYDDADFNYERRTGRGYVDVVVDRFPVGIVVETKSPRTKLNNYVEQVEYYVFKKLSHERAAIIAILTDGESFRIYGITEAVRTGSLGKHEIVESFTRSQIADPTLLNRLSELLARERNEAGATLSVIARYKSDKADKQQRVDTLDTQISDLIKQRDNINAQISELQRQRALILDAPITALGINSASVGAYDKKFPAKPHILRLLFEQGAQSKAKGVERKWLDEQLIGKVDGVRTDQAVSHSLIDLKKNGKIDYESKGKRIRQVWLK
jgi:predicted type IV restriction endonuclease